MEVPIQPNEMLGVRFSSAKKLEKIVPLYTGKFISLNICLMYRKSYIFFVHLIMSHMKQLNRNKTRFPQFDKILVI